MEKKRRARINISLEQLKALLEKHYSHQIRKRKLEKADILELSVKYMKSLQSSVQGKMSSADYQAGFRSCLHGVHQFLLRSEEASETSYFHLLQELARALPAGTGAAFSTTDSNPLAPPQLQESRLSELQALSLKADGSSKPFKQQPPGNDGPVSSGRAQSQAARSNAGETGVGASREQRAQVPNRTQALWRPW
uniref:Hes family bHLH transcription factor 3 n=1 Tax=Sphenodon punctatus TaxID=8508 RepID=A0A8D0GVZ5_SPHPU